MKTTLLALTLATFIFAAEQTTNGLGNIAFVDLQKALESVDAGKKAKSSLDKEMAAKKTEIEKQEQALRKEAEEFEKKAAILNDAAKAQKQQEFQKKVMEFQKKYQEAQGDLQKRQQELTKPLLDQLRAIIEGMGKEKKYSLVLEKSQGAVLYAEGGTDITQLVIDKFNAQYKGDKKDKKKS
jgi:outer membrane protein